MNTLKQLAAAVDICEDATNDMGSDNEIEAAKKNKIRASMTSLNEAPRIFNINQDSAPLQDSIHSVNNGLPRIDHQENGDDNHSSEELLLIMESHPLPLNKSLDTTQSKQDSKMNNSLNKFKQCTLESKISILKK